MSIEDMSESAWADFSSVQFVRPFFTEHTIPHGCLPNDWGAQALWNYFLMASHAEEQAEDSVDQQIVLEGERWHMTHFPQQARSIAFQYGVKIADMMQYWVFVDMECDRIGMKRASNAIRNTEESV